MQIKFTDDFGKFRLTIKYIYLSWLFFVFLFWLLSVFGTLGSDGYLDIKIIRSNAVLVEVLKNAFSFIDRFDFIQILIFLSPIYLLVIFIIISIIRRRVSVGEILVIAAIWGMVSYVFPHLRS